MNQAGIVIFGEVLFDHFPDGSLVLGGAPFNVAWHLQAFEQAPFFISRIGPDEDGTAVREAMQEWGMAMDGLQTDPELPTGRVDVKIVDGEPSYEILHPAAFDAIEAPVSGPGQVKLLYHGSLALRSPASGEALNGLRALRPGAIFVDVNLRPPWWQTDTVLTLAAAADWVKLNHQELDALCPTHAGKPEQAERFLGLHQRDGLLLTHGEKGAELFMRDGMYDRIERDRRIEPVDTVGAGDAFTAVMILGLVHGWPGKLTLSRAQAFASAVCTRRGATIRDREFYRAFLNEWQLEQ